MCSTLNLTCSFSTGVSHLMALLTRSLVFLLFVILYAVFLSVSITFLLLFSPQLELYSLFFTLSSNIIHIIQYIPGSFQSFQHQAVSHQSLRITSTVSIQLRTIKRHFSFKPSPSPCRLASAAWTVPPLGSALHLLLQVAALHKFTD